MNEEEKTGRIIANLLDHSLNDATPGTRYRLQAARRAALERYQSTEVLHAGTGISTQSGYHWFSAHAGRLLLTASLLLFLAIHSYWQVNNGIDDNIMLAPLILIEDPHAGSQEIKNADNDYEAADEADETAENTVSGEDADHGNYGGETNTADTSETEADTGDTADFDEITRPFNPAEIQDTENTTVPINAAQDSVTEDNTDITRDYLQDAKENITDSHDAENTWDSTTTIDE
ncbi:DUF3619 family protein [Nitrosomonas sp. HPC101]|uniref:DUF3619 family protein n=1 Tax=Nitrosomonas sp. HPC101 TaxID=1658667 RepID=UPI001368ABA2|nr:DUF3619 family protein [Nitrosomonas sp. HPC101]MXS84398.1 DUF3619 family protein [Nitrosomonas sp. HPC101]